MMKIEKNYFREEIKKIIDETGDLPVILTARFKYRKNQIWATFTTVRPYINKRQTSTFCDHINISLKDILRWRKLRIADHNRKFYIIGYIKTYIYNQDERGCIILADNLGYSPVLSPEEFLNLKEKLVEKCYKFSKNKYLEYIKNKK